MLIMVSLHASVPTAPTRRNGRTADRRRYRRAPPIRGGYRINWNNMGAPRIAPPLTLARLKQQICITNPKDVLYEPSYCGTLPTDTSEEVILIREFLRDHLLNILKIQLLKVYTFHCYKFVYYDGNNVYLYRRHSKRGLIAQRVAI
jgi:hypothetical protein